MSKPKPEDEQLLLFDIPVEKLPDSEIESKDDSQKQSTPKEDPELKPDGDQRAREIIALAREEGMDIRGIIVHDNIRTMASVDSRRRLRLQEIFLKADDKTIRSLVRYLCGKRRRGDDERIKSYISEHSTKTSISNLTKSMVKGCYGPVGLHFDLNEILHNVMKKYTGDLENIVIPSRIPSKGYRSVTWGTYTRLENGGLIKINALLDRLEVPRYVVEAVVHHELVHHLVPTKNENGRRVMHGKRFKEILSVNPNIRKSDKWKKQYFDKIKKKRSRRLY